MKNIDHFFEKKKILSIKTWHCANVYTLFFLSAAVVLSARDWVIAKNCLVRKTVKSGQEVGYCTKNFDKRFFYRV